MYRLFFTHRAKKDALLLKASNLDRKVKTLLSLIADDPYA